MQNRKSLRSVTVPAPKTLAKAIVGHLRALEHADGRATQARGSAPPRDTQRWADLSPLRSLLDLGSKYVVPHLQEGSNLRAIKGLVFRGLRVVLRQQSALNAALVDVLRGLMDAVDGGFAKAAENSAQLQQQMDELRKSWLEESARWSDRFSAFHREPERRVAKVGRSGRRMPR